MDHLGTYTWPEDKEAGVLLVIWSYHNGEKQTYFEVSITESVLWSFLF